MNDYISSCCCFLVYGKCGWLNASSGRDFLLKNLKTKKHTITKWGNVCAGDAGSGQSVDCVFIKNLILCI